jgi:hypothetical protein
MDHYYLKENKNPNEKTLNYPSKTLTDHHLAFSNPMMNLETPLHNTNYSLTKKHPTTFRIKTQR